MENNHRKISSLGIAAILFGCLILLLLSGYVSYVRFTGGELIPSSSSVKIDYDDETATITVDGNSYQMIEIAGGQFKMGSQLGAKGASSNEAPQHGVSVSDFKIGKTEVPQWLWVAVMGDDSEATSYFTGDDLPMENVSYNDCIEFIERLNKATGAKFRLPTEAEWEYAARGGKQAFAETLYAGSDSITLVAWVDANSSRATHDVGTLQANPQGLLDMSGNVAEWTADYYGLYHQGFLTDPTGPATSGSKLRVTRGGSFKDADTQARIKARRQVEETTRSSDIGLRLAMD